MLPSVLVDRGLKTEEEERLRRFCEPVLVEIEEAYTEDELVAALVGYRGLIKGGNRIPDLTRKVFEQASDLEIVAVQDDRFGTGLDIEAAAEHGVQIIDTSNFASHNPVAEWNLAMILMTLRNYCTLYRQVMEGSERWAITPNEGFVSGELTGRKVGLIGLGHINQRLIELLRPFGVDLMASDPYVGDQLVARLGVVCGDLDAVLEHAQILVVQVPHTPKTEKMIGARELELLGKGNIIVSCCRGKVIDQRALVAKVEAGELIAGLDVFDTEPMPKGDPVRLMKNVCISPHVAWYSPDSLHKYFTMMAEDFERYFRGEPLQHHVTARMVDIRNGRI